MMGCAKMIGITPSVHFQRQELTGTSKLSVTNNLFGIIDRHFSHALNEDNQAHDDSHHDGYFYYENENTSATQGSFGIEFLFKRVMQPGKDSNDNDQ